MKIVTSDVKKWVILNVDGQLRKVVDTAHTHMGRWGATDRFKVKSITTGKMNTFTYNAWSTLEQADVKTSNAVYLYNNRDIYTFMENDTGEMYDLDKDIVDDIAGYLKENMDCYVTVYQGNVIGVILPPTVSYTITSTVPGVKWDRAQAGKKPATIETGLEIMVPLHKNEGDTVTLNTLTWETN